MQHNSTVILSCKRKQSTVVCYIPALLQALDAFVDAPASDCCIRCSKLHRSQLQAKQNRSCKSSCRLQAKPRIGTFPFPPCRQHDSHCMYCVTFPAVVEGVRDSVP